MKRSGSLKAAIAITLMFAAGCTHKSASGAQPGNKATFGKREAILFAMTDDELFKAGITSVDGDWAVAWSADTAEDADAVQGVLTRVDVAASGSSGRGRCGWYVARKDFFVAQRALLGDRRVRELGIKVVQPMLPPNESK